MNIRILFLTIASRIIRNSYKFILRLKGYKNISRKASIEHGVKLDKVNPSGIHIDDYAHIASGTVILSHESIIRNENDPFIPHMTDTFIGKKCFIGVNVLIYPGVKIGDECIISAGAIVDKNIPSNRIVYASGCNIKDNLEIHTNENGHLIAAKRIKKTSNCNEQ